MRTFASVVELNDYLTHHGEMVITTNPKQLQALDVRLYALANGDFNPAHCVPGFEEHTLLKGISSQGSAIVARAEGEFCALPLFHVQPEIIALGMNEVTYSGPLHVGDRYHYIFTFRNMRKGKRMYKFECSIVCEKFDEETQAWACVTKWLWFPAYVDHAEQIGAEAVECLQSKSYVWNVWRYVVPLCVLRIGRQMSCRLAACAPVCALTAILCVGLWPVTMRYSAMVVAEQRTLSNGQPTCALCTYTDAM